MRTPLHQPPSLIDAPAVLRQVADWLAARADYAGGSIIPEGQPPLLPVPEAQVESDLRAFADDLEGWTPRVLRGVILGVCLTAILYMAIGIGIGVWAW